MYDTNNCNEPISGANCRGYCVEKCGGKTGLICNDFMVECIDSPFDSCDPENGGTDCIGFCTSNTDGMWYVYIFTTAYMITYLLSNYI